MNDEKIRADAIDFAKHNKLHIAREVTNTSMYVPDETPVSVFMAGSPGAGKTEFSKRLVAILEHNRKRRVVRIDGDELRTLFPGYVGSNSNLFQGAVSLVIEKVHDLVLHNKQNFVFDGTLADFDKAVENIRRSFERGRPVFIFYIYQKPDVAWRFTQAREIAEGRNIPKEAFIEQFLAARETVSRLLLEFGTTVNLFIVKKNFETNSVEDLVEIQSVEQIDATIKERYSKDDLHRLI